MIAQGGEGVVVTPLDVMAHGRRGSAQPAIKGHGRALALREWALGIEALECCVMDEPPRRVHASVFGGLALESEPVNPRL